MLLYIIGVVLSVIAVLDIVKKPIGLIGKIISAALVLMTSWVGLLVYFLYAKNHLTEWFKYETGLPLEHELGGGLTFKRSVPEIFFVIPRSITQYRNPKSHNGILEPVPTSVPSTARKLSGSSFICSKDFPAPPTSNRYFPNTKKSPFFGY